MKIFDKPTTMAGWIELFLAFWGIVGIAFVFLAKANWIPGYEVQVVRKTDIRTTLSIYPSQKIRLGVDPVEGKTSDIQLVNWSLTKAKGDPYKDELPSLREIDIQLNPDYVGIVNVAVTTKMIGDPQERFGLSTFQIVPTDLQVASFEPASIQLPSDWKAAYTDTLEVYEGNGHWNPVDAESAVLDQSMRMLQLQEVPVWNGLAIVRYKIDDRLESLYQENALPVVATNFVEPESIQN